MEYEKGAVLGTRLKLDNRKTMGIQKHVYTFVRIYI